MRLDNYFNHIYLSSTVYFLIDVSIPVANYYCSSFYLFDDFSFETNMIFDVKLEWIGRVERNEVALFE